MEPPKILWLEDQIEDLRAYISIIHRFGYRLDHVASVSEAEEKLKNDNYDVVIFDIKVIPGDDPKWIELDKIKQKENPYFDSSLGFEFLFSLFAPQKARVKIDPPIILNPHHVIVFSVVYDKVDEISSLGIPANQILHKSSGNIYTIANMIKKIIGEKILKQSSISIQV